MGNIDYKSKYEELKSVFIEQMDISFRKGFELGVNEGMQSAAAEQQQMQAQAQPGQPGQPQPGQEGQEGQEGMEQQAPASELDQHIQQLEGFLGKPEESVGTEDVQKAIKEFKAFKTSVELAKSARSINALSLDLHKPQFKLSQSATKNLNTSSKNALSLQEKIVQDMMKTWAEEEHRASVSIIDTIKAEGLLK